MLAPGEPWGGWAQPKYDETCAFLDKAGLVRAGLSAALEVFNDLVNNLETLQYR